MLIDDDEVCLAVGRKILENKYTVHTVTSGEQAFAILKNVIPDLILLDIDLPVMDGYAVIKHLKQENAAGDIPVIFVTAYNDTRNELDGLSLGAIDYITKPFAPSLLIQRIENHLLINTQKKELLRFNQRLRHMVEDQTKEIKKLQNAILNTVSGLVELRDKMSGGHIERIQKYIQTMIDTMREKGLYADKIETWDIEAFINAVQMHDVGNIYVSEAILNKPGRITPVEFDEIKKHPVYGSMIIDRMRQMTDNHSFLDFADVIAESHHERWDGSGYPNGLKEHDIPLAGRLVALADVYDALVSSRPYKQPMSPNEAAEEIIRGSGTAFDPALVAIFETVTDEFAVISERHDMLMQ